MMGEAPISLFCVCFNKRASVWCFLLPELIMIGVGRRERGREQRLVFMNRRQTKLICCAVWTFEGFSEEQLGKILPINMALLCSLFIFEITLQLCTHQTQNTCSEILILRQYPNKTLILVYFSFTSVDHRKAWSGGCLLSWWYLGMLHRPGSHRPNGPGLVTI